MHPSQPKELYQVTFDPPEEEVMFRSSTRNVKLGKQINSSNFSEKLYMHRMSLATASHSIRKYCTYEKSPTMISVRAELNKAEKKSIKSELFTNKMGFFFGVFFFPSSLLYRIIYELYLNYILITNFLPCRIKPKLFVCHYGSNSID